MGKIKSLIYKILIAPHRRRSLLKLFKKCGERVSVGKGGTFIGHIEVGNRVFINDGAYFVSTRAKLIIQDYVMIAPNVTIYTGDHATNVVGKHIIDITDSDKDQLSTEFDQDVIIGEGAWIGTRAIILKGVRIGKGAVIGAGAIVTRDVPDYHVYVGSPLANKLYPRFTPEELVEHERIINGEQ